MNYDNNTFQWAIDESLWDDKDFIIEKLSTIKNSMYKGAKNSKLCEKIKLINPEHWKDKEFVTKMIKENSEVLYSLFVLSPIFNDVDSQIELEKTLLENINEEGINHFSYFWNGYLKYNYIYYHRSDDFMTYIGENEYQFNQHFNNENSNDGFFNLFYSHEKGLIAENKEKYKVVIELLEEKILSKKVIDRINSTTFGEEQYHKHIIQNLHQGNNKLDGEVYVYLPESLKSNNYLIENYIGWAQDIINTPALHQFHHRIPSKEIYAKPKKYQSNIYVDYNAVPLEYFNDDQDLKKMSNYLKSFILNSSDKKANHKLSLGKRSLIVQQWLSKESTTLDVLKCIIKIDNDQISVFWEKYISKSMKENKSFVLDFLNIEQNNSMMFISSAKSNIFKMLPNRFKEDRDIQLAYLKHNGGLKEINKFPLYELDDIKDSDLIKNIIGNNSSLFMESYLKYEEDIEYKEKMLNKVGQWKTNINFLCAYTQSIAYISLKDNEWELILSEENAIDKLLEKDNFKIFVTYLPNHLHTESIILKSLNRYKGLNQNLEIENKFFSNIQFCQEILKYGNCYIKQIPDQFWDNKEYFIKVFEYIDNKEIGKDILHEMPIRIKQFLEMYDINDNYEKHITSAILREKLSNQLDIKPESLKKKKI